jgi:hypothetical protein
MAWNPLRTILERQGGAVVLWILIGIVYGLVKLAAWLWRVAN